MVSMKELFICLISDESRGLVGSQGMVIGMTNDQGERDEDGKAN